MTTYPFMQVDAFTERPLAGNPCAIIFDADDLTAEQMQAIAKEMNLSETAFVLKSQIADVRARYFTPAEEIPLAGHPTIATIHALVERGDVALNGDYTKISLELQVGPIPIELYPAPTGVCVVMNQKKPEFLATLSPEEVMPHFGLEAADCLPNALPQIVSTGTPQLMIPVRDFAALRRAWLNSATYPAFRDRLAFSARTCSACKASPTRATPLPATLACRRTRWKIRLPARPPAVWRPIYGTTACSTNPPSPLSKATG
jgi:trans-2,3-dihydro-3-hydroxyanthranilate isomerase